MTRVPKCLSAILAALALGLTACGSGDNSNVANDINVSTNEQTDVLDDVVPPPDAPPPKRYALDDAARRGLIEYEVRGNGSSSGESLQIKVQRLSAEPIQIYVAPGTVFKTGSKGVQSMVARSIVREIAEAAAESAVEAALEAALEETGVVELADNAVRNLVIEAYCRDFELENPSEENGFVTASVDARSAAILQAADEQGLGTAATQAAVWMDRGVEPEAIAKKFEASPADFEAASRLLAQLPRRG